MAAHIRVRGNAEGDPRLMPTARKSKERLLLLQDMRSGSSAQNCNDRERSKLTSFKHS